MQRTMGVAPTTRAADRSVRVMEKEKAPGRGTEFDIVDATVQGLDRPE